ncbi:hypothetical protein V1520DRAFT_388899 [Lipomyces starkeyi]|uniref:Homeobox domain-containing protein n=1 Tax=Lipomyces starkeyi NRRL Y-11557 TaxID=675824 RepID=A0A1E3QAD9_LIPST|nr:hypothetical protein LIPSTDRAFT_347004 [Lipomyces starkeyi NRRL Y-11557]
MFYNTDLAISNDSNGTTTLTRLLALKTEIASLLSDVEGDLIQNSAHACKLVMRAAEELSKLACAAQIDPSIQTVSLAIRRDIAKIHAITSHVYQFENDIDLMISIRQLHYRYRTRIAQRLALPDPIVGTSFNRSGISKSSKLQLRNWMHEHRRFPNLTAEEERDLQKTTGINKRQLDRWLTILRRRSLQHSNLSSDLQCILGFVGEEHSS